MLFAKILGTEQLELGELKLLAMVRLEVILVFEVRSGI